MGVPLRIAAETTRSVRTELVSSDLIAASRSGVYRGRVNPVIGRPILAVLSAGVRATQLACSCLAALTARCQKLTASIDQVLSAIAVFCTHSLTKRVVVSPPLMEEFG